MWRHNPDSIAELLEHLARQLHGSSFVEGLKPAQWNALRYLGRANPSACTVSAFASFHATTKSAASQTIRLLQKKDLVQYTTSADDGRVKYLGLTPKGRQLLQRDPLSGVRAALRKCDANDLAAFLGVLDVLLRTAFLQSAEPSRHLADR